MGAASGRPMRAGGARVLDGGMGLLAVANAYLLTLLVAAIGRRRRRPPTVAPGPSFAVLVPAHDEQDTIGDAVAALRRMRYPAGGFEVIVVADNCGDATALRAREAGATVWEREDPRRRGKGAALRWAMERLDADGSAVDAVAVVDADCVAAPGLLEALGARLGDGAGAAQADYVVANPGESVASALRYAGFALINTVRPLGKDRLGLSCGLLGSGMAFDRALLARVPFDSDSITEDADYHARLVAAGERVRFADETSVSSPMPSSLRASRDQHARWEGGRWALVRDWTPRLLARAVRRRSAASLHQALEPLVPPQSLLAAANVGMAALAFAAGSRRARRLGAANVLAQVAFVLGGLRLVGAPASVYRALLHAPALALARGATWCRVLAGRGPAAWVRTAREPAADGTNEGGGDTRTTVA